MIIRLYVNKSEPNRIGKTLTGEVEYNGSLKSECSVLRPVVTIADENLSRFNYMYIPQFHRYYFIRDMVAVRSGLWRITSEVDVLESYKTGILNQKAILDDSQSEGTNNYLQGQQWTAKVKTLTDIINFNSGLLDTGEYILITAGG